MRLIKSCILSTSVALLVPLAVQAESLHPKLDSVFNLDVGGYAPSIDTTLRVDRASGFGTDFDLEDDLDLKDRETLPFALMNFRLGERWRIEAEYFTLGRDATHVTSRDLTIGDVTFPAGGLGVSTNFDTDIYRLSAGYSFLKAPNYEMGASLGAHVTTFDLAIRSLDGLRAESADTLAPLVTLGLYGQYALSPKWLLAGRVDVFALEYEEYSGSLVNVNAAIEYQVARHFGLGLGYRYVDLDLEADPTLAVGSNDWGGEFNYVFSGPTLYLSMVF